MNLNSKPLLLKSLANEDSYSINMNLSQSILVFHLTNQEAHYIPPTSLNHCNWTSNFNQLLK
jgi:hypothetical protein